MSTFYQTMANDTWRDLFEDSHEMEQFLLEYERHTVPLTKKMLPTVDPSPMLQGGELFGFDLIVIGLTVVLILYVVAHVIKQYRRQFNYYDFPVERPPPAQRQFNVEPTGMRMMAS